MSGSTQGYRLIARFTAVLCGAGLLAATRLTAVAALADWHASHRPEGLPRALELAPNSALYWELRSFTFPIVAPEYRSAIEAALKNDSHSGRLWMKLGDAAASTGDLDRAESAYLEAGKFNRNYDPHWLLANLYFREAENAKFWEQIRQALSFAERDLSADFDLCWAVGKNPDEILEAIPHKPRILARYVDYLLRTNRLDEASKVAHLLIPNAKEEASTLGNFVERFIQAKRTSEAYAIWTSFAGKPGGANLLVNANWQETISSRGFDWHWEAPGNVGHIQIPNLMQADFQFDGNQPEKCDLLRQPLALTPGSGHRFTFDFRTLDIDTHSGLRWRIDDIDSGEIGVSEEMYSLPWKSSVMLFRVPKTSRGQQLILGYQRPRGTTRSSGTLAVRTPVLKQVD